MEQFTSMLWRSQAYRTNNFIRKWHARILGMRFLVSWHRQVSAALKSEILRTKRWQSILETSSNYRDTPWIVAGVALQMSPTHGNLSLSLAHQKRFA